MEKRVQMSSLIGSVSWAVFSEKQKQSGVDITTLLSTRIFLCMRGGGQERKELTGLCNYRG